MNTTIVGKSAYLFYFSGFPEKCRNVPKIVGKGEHVRHGKNGAAKNLLGRMPYSK